MPDKVYSLRSGGRCTINNMGFRRMGDTSYHKRAGVVRIVAPGGSSTFSFHTDNENLWTAVLEQKLNYQIRPIRPDIVMVYHTWNDMKLFSPIEKESI